MDLLIESQRQLREDFQKRKEKKKKVVIGKPVEEKNLTIHVSQLLFYFNASEEKTIPNFQR